MGILRRIWRVYPVWRIALGKGVKRDKVRGTRGFVLRLGDLLRWYILYGEIMHYYYAFDFQHKTRREQDEYLSWRELDRIRENMSRTLVDPHHPISYKILAYDKFVANNYLCSLNIPCVPNEALINDNKVIWKGGRVDKLDSLISAELGTLFIKPVTGLGGTGVLKIDLNHGVIQIGTQRLSTEQLATTLKGCIWVVQKEVKQHREINSLCSKTVNTMRIITVFHDNKPEFFSATMRIARGDSVVDNWDKGSLSVGIEHATGTLMAEAYLKPDGLSIPKCYTHPDSGIELQGFKLPHYHAAVDVCLRAHEYFYGIFMIGWDVAIAEEGPVIIEVNSEPTLHAQQLSHGGLRRQVMELTRHTPASFTK